jgi:site-specific recombinase XerD
LPTTVVGTLLAQVPSWLGVGSHTGAGAKASETGVLALRDAALVALGLRLMRRGAEIAALTTRDVEETVDGVTVTIRRSKTDQTGIGLQLPVEESDTPTCPVRLLRRWLSVRSALAVRGTHCDALFLSARGTALTTSAISAIVKRSAAAAGLSGSFSAHSLRIGGATAAMGAGASLATIQAMGGWSSDAVQRYLRPVAAAKAGFSSAIGL